MDNKKEFSDFETIAPLKNYLKSNPNLSLEINAVEKWDGWCQLKEDEKKEKVKFYDIFSEIHEEVITVIKNNDGTQNVKFHDSHENGFDYKKEVYESDYFTWAKVIIEIDFFLEKINEFIDENSEDDDLYDFFEFLDFGSKPEGIIEYFESKEYESGIGTEEFLNNISWCVPNLVDWSDFNFNFK
tara:strand:+ start:682 stop:1236 length:555 start_codon:yes stop_codon:yes gene_type:complete